MNKNTFSLLGICAAAALLVSPVAKAQIFFNNGAEVYVTAGLTPTTPTIVQINGGLQNDNLIGGPGVIDNEGDITVTSNGAWPGNIDLTNTAILQGNGKYHLEQDWINDAVFIHGTSMVEMYGSKAEYITSTKGVITTFDTLVLIDRAKLAPHGSLNARKIQTLDAKDTGALVLNDRVLWTQNHTMFVINPAVGCVTNTPTVDSEGFVQSESVGRLSRMTTSASRYFYPVGSDSNAGLPRYRPVYMTPAAATPNTYAVRMADVDATNEGDSIKLLDSTICTVNPLFYHQIDRTAGASNADIDIYYDAARDGAWTGIAEWNTIKPIVWNDLGLVTATAAVPYNDNLKKNWGTFSPNPFILDNAKPGAPSLTCPGVCANADGTFTVTGVGSSYTWTTPPGTTIVSGQGTDSLVVNWNGVPGTISVIANSVGGCASAPATCNVTVNPSPVAGYDTVSTGTYKNTWGFTDTSTVKGTITGWMWNFGDGNTSNQQDPTHFYSGPGTYVVIETVTNSSGCTARKMDTLIVPEGFYMPNVITPNGDGKNDVLTIQCSGTSSFSLEIFNRWGQEIFTTNSVDIAWDGRTNAGVKVSDGTYYYIVKATSLSGKDWSRNGFITVLSSGVAGQ